MLITCLFVINPGRKSLGAEVVQPQKYSYSLLVRPFTSVPVLRLEMWCNPLEAKWLTRQGDPRHSFGFWSLILPKGAFRSSGCQKAEEKLPERDRPGYIAASYDD